MSVFRTTYSSAPRPEKSVRRDPVHSVAVKSEPRAIVQAACRQGRRTDSQQAGYIHGARAYANDILALAEQGKLSEEQCKQLCFVKVTYRETASTGVVHLPLPKSTGFVRVGPALGVQEREYHLAVYMWAVPLNT